MIYGLTRGGQHPHREARDRDLVAWLDHRMAGIGNQLRITAMNSSTVGRAGWTLAPWSMKCRSESLGQLFEATEMIAVPVGDDQMIDLGKPRILGQKDALGIAQGAGRRHIAGIDEQKFARGRHQQRGIATLHIDHIDVERGPARAAASSEWPGAGKPRAQALLRKT